MWYMWVHCECEPGSCCCWWWWWTHWYMLVDIWPFNFVSPQYVDVCSLSVCLTSHACIVTKLNGALQIFWYHTKGQSLCYSETNSSWWATPPCVWNMHSKWPTSFEMHWFRQVSAYKVSAVRDCKKNSVMTNRKSTMGFPTSYRWSAYVTPKSPQRLAQKLIFQFFWNKTQFQSNEVCYKVSMCENFQWQSCRVVSHLWNNRNI